MEPSDIYQFIMVGGSSRIPKLQELMKKLFGKERECFQVNEDEAVAIGATIRAQEL